MLAIAGLSVAAGEIAVLPGDDSTEKTALLEGYVNRITSRTAYARAQAKENG